MGKGLRHSFPPFNLLFLFLYTFNLLFRNCKTYFSYNSVKHKTGFKNGEKEEEIAHTLHNISAIKVFETAENRWMYRTINNLINSEPTYSPDRHENCITRHCIIFIIPWNGTYKQKVNNLQNFLFPLPRQPLFVQSYCIAYVI